MPRKRIIRSSEHYYHLVGRTNNKEVFPLDLESVWKIMCRELSLLQKEFDLEISAFVLMSNHFHLTLLTPKEDIDRVMYFFMKNVTRKILYKSGRVNRIFGGRYRGSLISNDQYLLTVYKYIYRNPVVAGMCERVEDYHFSTYSTKDLAFKLSRPWGLERFVESEWLNTPFRSEEAKSIKLGLGRTEFRFQKDRFTSRLIEPPLP